MNRNLPLSIRIPARYLGTEVNLPRKHLRKGMFHVVLAFADIYEVGMSHIGLKILYHILNSHDDIFCERVFAPWPDMRRFMRERGTPLSSLETQTPLKDFDMVGFSLQYELSYPTLLAMIEMGGIPLRSKERTGKDPFVLAGGPCAVNPEPLAPFMDAFVIGDGERVILEVSERLKRSREREENRDKTLEALAEIEGVYVPSLSNVTYSLTSGRPTAVDPYRGKGAVHRRIEKDIRTLPFPTREVIPLVRAIHDRYAVEIARGCLQGCRFCQAGFIYRPYRERNQTDVLKLLQEGLKETGYDECSFLSLSAGDYSQVTSLLAMTASQNLGSRISISMPSLRISSLTPEMVQQIGSIRKTGFTLAPEAGTQRLRDVINKKITEDEIFTTTETIFKAGWHLVKLYFMIGLPTEQPDDIEGIVSLVTRIWRMARTISRKNEVTASISTFVPKPHTPFQWCKMVSIEEIREKQGFLRKHLSRNGLRVKWHDARLSFYEGVISRGGRPLSKFLTAVEKGGAYLDGWTDQFSQEAWETARAEFDTISFTSGLRKWERDAILPWDVIDIGIRKEYLWNEYQRALNATVSPPCPVGRRCRLCGICDENRKVSIKLSDPPPTPTVPISDNGTRQVVINPGDVKQAYFHASFIKVGNARFLGHLDTVRAILMAARRSGLPMDYSKGFHPAPRVRFSLPIPLGMESLCETVEFKLIHTIDPTEFKKAINDALPPGLRLTRVRCATLKIDEGFDKLNKIWYLCLLRIFKAEEAYRLFNLASRIRAGEIKNYHVLTKNGPVEVPISKCLLIEDIKQMSQWIKFHVQIKGLPSGVRAFTLITGLFGVEGKRGREIRMIKIKVPELLTGTKTT